jgi:hypothetical protein
MKTASERAKEMNDETRVWLTAGPGRGAGLLVEDADFWAECKVFTADDLDRHLAIGTYSDVYKERYGFRPRHSVSSLTTEQIEEKIRDLMLAQDVKP